MPRVVRCALIQAANIAPPDSPLDRVKSAMLEKHEVYIAQAAASGAGTISPSRFPMAPP
jgi:hypothetical protein